MFIFIRRHQTVFLSGSILIYSHQQCMSDSRLPFPHQHLVSALFFVSVSLFFIVVLIGIFLNVNDVHFSCSYLSSEHSSLVKCQFMCFACCFLLFMNWNVFFLIPLIFIELGTIPGAWHTPGIRRHKNRHLCTILVGKQTVKVINIMNESRIN